ncbi:NAD(P)H-dependent oxidoreductase [Corynebacterium simulans]|uniref:NADPH-dependent FMN reductase family protein n=1 Tax=Corynebacterium simulans TaxID=146827 RepID=A0ABR5VFH1_9CORY|nr:MULTISPECIES: NAD(P)H-dependent oxidoreductase [Corynebacterium]NTS21658.1 NAD(P)H-dependent oxidoreductase [Bacteroides fragilis]AMO89012.1 NADPH-dependent FMN reductase family protein [Corynebacterium simulans]AMO91682.1 NADPH-dependent FMN reductase family protein [Corynebacterium simulans]KXU19215.1 NADPH-dependent FMN reductase family protein [Corynebacterium simulans]MCG7248258.1 NAD(P)H-dependent oxidoreductase [Corynebacterium simulans]
MAKIGIVLGSTRDDRAGEAIANWVGDLAKGRNTGVEYEVIDLKAFNVPIMTTSVIPMAANKSYDDANVQAWSDAIDSCDGYVFVTPEYNHSVPGPFKNAFDSLGAEWVNKSIAFVGYSFSGGIRAVEAWRLAVANFSMKQLRTQVEVNLITDMNEGAFAPADFKIGLVDNMLAELEDSIAS